LTNGRIVRVKRVHAVIFRCDENNVVLRAIDRQIRDIKGLRVNISVYEVREESSEFPRRHVGRSQSRLVCIQSRTRVVAVPGGDADCGRRRRVGDRDGCKSAY